MNIGRNQFVVADFPAHQETQIVLTSEAGTALGLAGHDILLYAPLKKIVVDAYPGLIALDMRTGYTQQLADFDQFVVQAVGNSKYAAWLNTSGELFETDLHLQPTGQTLILGTPAPTAQFIYPAMHPSPMWTPVLLATSSPSPTGTPSP
jgi:hypothetical protein